MSDNKFINKQTVAYLQSKRDATTEKEVQNLKYRLDLEYNYLNNLITNHAEELTNKTSVLGKEVLNLQKQQQAETLMTAALVRDLAKRVERIEFSLRITSIALIVGGVALWLTKLLT